MKSWWILDWKGSGKSGIIIVFEALVVLCLFCYLLFPVVRRLWWYFAAVYFEQGEYEKCIAECEKAVEVGREQRADFTIIAKWVLIRFQPLLPFGVATIIIFDWSVTKLLWHVLQYLDCDFPTKYCYGWSYSTLTVTSQLNTVMAGLTVPWPWLPY